jgi:hypothetical protein
MAIAIGIAIHCHCAITIAIAPATRCLAHAATAVQRLVSHAGTATSLDNPAPKPSATTVHEGEGETATDQQLGKLGQPRPRRPAKPLASTPAPWPAVQSDKGRRPVPRCSACPPRYTGSSQTPWAPVLTDWNMPGLRPAALRLRRTRPLDPAETGWAGLQATCRCNTSPSPSPTPNTANGLHLTPHRPPVVFSCPTPSL